MFTTNELSDII